MWPICGKISLRMQNRNVRRLFYGTTGDHGLDYFEKSFIPKFGNITTIGLLLTLVIIFSFQGDIILNNPLHIVLIAVPLIIQTFLIFFIAYLASRALKLPHGRRDCNAV